MNVISRKAGGLLLLAMTAIPASGTLYAQDQDQPQPQDNVTVVGSPVPQAAEMAAGPEIKGVISARNGERMKVTATDGTTTVVAINEATRIKAGAGLFGGSRSKLGTGALLNGLPVTVKTLQSDSGLVASQISFRNTDLKTATMIRNGTAQRFDEQAAATEALRGRLGDIDQYNVKSTTNVHFDTGKSVLSAQAKAELCTAATQAQATENALMLVVGYTDSRGSEDYNQRLSEQRAGRVINYLQQVCGWKPYRMLTPTGMAEADPLASNDTAEGMAQNRRVSVNVLVSKSLDGL